MDTRPHITEWLAQGPEVFCQATGSPRYRWDQLRDWVFKKHVLDLDQMPNLPRSLRDQLASLCRTELPKVISQQTSQDGSTKLLLRTHSGHTVESVILRYEARTSLCVSSQVGCKLACNFCQTGKLGFVSHLTAGDILSQWFVANQILTPERRRLSHVVFMGMGEPFDNYTHVLTAVSALIDEPMLNLAARHVTVSTSGLVPKIEQFARDSKAALAVSLHSAIDDTRTRLMPINRKYPLARLKQALSFYQAQTGRKITIEYILIDQVNCGAEDARALVRFLQGLKVKVNLIPFNAHPGLPYERPSEETILAFQKHLSSRSIPAPVRYSKGLDVSAACGQLAAKLAHELGALPQRDRIRPVVPAQGVVNSPELSKL